MAQDLTIELDDRPGTLAEVGEALGQAGINISGLCGFPCQGKGRLHLLVDDGASARRALEEAGIDVAGDREVIVLDLQDRPETFGEAMKKLAAVEVNVDLAYLATRTRLVVGADDLDKASTALR